MNSSPIREKSKRKKDTYWMYTGEVCPKRQKHLNDIQLFSIELKFNDGRRHFESYLGNHLYDGTK